MVGSVLCKRLQTLDIPHLKLSRHPSHSSKDQVFWDPHEKILETEKLREVETVIHLAGEPVGKRWTHEIKKKIIFIDFSCGYSTSINYWFWSILFKLEWSISNS